MHSSPTARRLGLAASVIAAIASTSVVALAAPVSRDSTLESVATIEARLAVHPVTKRSRGPTGAGAGCHPGPPPGGRGRKETRLGQSARRSPAGRSSAPSARTGRRQPTDRIVHGPTVSSARTGAGHRGDRRPQRIGRTIHGVLGRLRGPPTSQHLQHRRPGRDQFGPGG